jgi:hypothetical protein
MKRAAIVVFGIGFITGCSSGSKSGETADASRDGAEDGGACGDAGAPPSTLQCTGLYADFATKEVAPGALPYTPAYPLWSDGAQKARWIMLPPGTQIDDSDPNEWTFPVGTKLFKEFRIDGKRVETRMFQKLKADFWTYATYAWNGDDSDAVINYGGTVPVGDSGVTWTIPDNDECDECHRGRLDRILGFDVVNLGLSGAQGLTLADLVAMNLISPAPASTSLTIGDDGTGLDPLALGWIHTNCGTTCHNSNASAEAYGAKMLLRLDPSQLDGSPPNPQTWDVLKTTLDVPCVSGAETGLPRIVPGDAKDSVLYQLIDERGDGGLQMPPIASAIVDTADTAVVGAWIRAMSGGETDGGMEGGEDSGPDGAMEDGGPKDSGMLDGSKEAGESDTGVADSSSHDTGASDAGPSDASPSDAGSSEAAASDGGAGDGG